MVAITEIRLLIMQALNNTHKNAIAAAKRAHETATSKESVAKSKYETFGLEASYLAHGQSVRVAQCKADIDAFEAMFTTMASLPIKADKVALGRLIELIDNNDKSHFYFIGPSAGGLKVECSQYCFMVVTPASPLGKAMMNRQLGEEFVLNVMQQQTEFEIVSIN